MTAFRFTRAHRGSGVWYWPILAVILASHAVTDAWALPQSLSGSIQVNAVSSETGNQHQSTLNQRYALHWSKRLSPYLTAQTSLSYDRYGTDSDLSGSTWRQQVQPVGELGWNHPLFSAAITYRRLASSSRDETISLVRNSFGVSLRSRLTKYPILSLRFDNDETYNELNREDRDTQDRRYQAGLTYNVSNHSLFYNFTHRNSDIRSSGTEVNESSHLFRWDQTTRFFSDRLRLTTGYNFSHRRQVTYSNDGTTTYRTIPVVSALHGQDASPDFGALDSLRTLADGNISDPALPLIDIGQNITSQNLGADFGFARAVLGLYIYTDRPSGSGVSWTVYTSSDNLTWESLPSTAQVMFNTSFSRYEIVFSPVSTRYIKAVSGGLNEILTVLVTEIEAIEEEFATAKSTRTQNTHQGDASVGYRISEQLGTTVDLHYRGEPSGNVSDRREQFFYGVSVRHTPSKVLAQTAGYQASRENFSAGLSRLSTHALSYAVTATPLQTLEFNFSAISRRNFDNGIKQQETNGALVRATGEVFRTLRLTADAGFSRTDQPLDSNKYDSWTYQTSADAGITRALDAVVTYLYQRSRDVQHSTLRIRNQITANMNWRLSRNIVLRSTVSRNNDDGREHISQEYSGVWRLSPRLSVSALTSTVESAGDIRTRRDNVLLNYKVGNASSVSFSYSDTESGTGSDSNSFQVGFRSGF